MVGHTPPDPATGHLHPQRHQASGVHIVQLHQRQPGRKSRLRAPVKVFKLSRQAPAAPELAPVIEIPGHQQRRRRRHFARDKTLQLRHLARPAGLDQPQVHHHHMHGSAMHHDLDMQQTTLFKTVIRNSSCWCATTGQRDSMALPCSPCRVNALVRYTAS